MIRGQGAPRVVPLRTQVRGHHSLSLTDIWPAICWFFLIVSIPDFQKNVWPNISVSLAKGRINDYGTMLWWNLSAPCRLSGEVWLCQEHGIRQQLSNGTWRQNKEGMWVRLLIPNCIAFIKLFLFPGYETVKEEDYVNWNETAYIAKKGIYNVKVYKRISNFLYHMRFNSLYILKLGSNLERLSQHDSFSQSYKYF